MRFRPQGGLGQTSKKDERDATQARAEVVGGEQSTEKLFEQRHKHEIERAENIAAGLPPGGAPAEPNAPAHSTGPELKHEPVSLQPLPKEPPFKPIPVAEPNKGLVDRIVDGVATIKKKVLNLIRPEKKTHKEVIINAETLETRVAVLEEGKLEEFNIERTTEERLVGSIFKGRVRNLEDGLKAMFVDIGFEKNAFLHYWDIIPNQFDSGVEIVEREGRKRDKPKITQKDVPRLYPPGHDIIDRKSVV